MFSGEEITWPCHICKDERPDDKISVYRSTITFGENDKFSMQQNVRYCNDRDMCREMAPFHRFA